MRLREEFSLSVIINCPRKGSPAYHYKYNDLEGPSVVLIDFGVQDNNSSLIVQGIY
jgi:hypothetical protein